MSPRVLIQVSSNDGESAAADLVEFLSLKASQLKTKKKKNCREQGENVCMCVCMFGCQHLDQEQEKDTQSKCIMFVKPAVLVQYSLHWYQDTITFMLKMFYQS